LGGDFLVVHFDLLTGQEVEMNNERLFPFQNLDAYRVARELARRVHLAKIRDRELRDQATRAAKSCFLCLCEGLPNEGAAMRHKYFVESRNSLAETVGALDLAAAIGVVRQEDANAVQELGSRLRRMLTALLR
jgi:four helix bundle protein